MKLGQSRSIFQAGPCACQYSHITCCFVFPATNIIGKLGPFQSSQFFGLRGQIQTPPQDYSSIFKWEQGDKNQRVFLKMKLAEQSQLLVIWPFPRGVWSYLGISEPVYSNQQVKLAVPEEPCPYPTPGHGMGSVLRHGGGFKIPGDKIPSNKIFNQSAVCSLVSPKFNPSIGEAKGVEGASDVAFCDGSASVYIWSAEVGAVIRW